MFFSCTGIEIANNIDVAITTSSGLHAVPKNITLEKVSGKATPTVVKVYFYVTKEAIPNKLEATVVATYKTAKVSSSLLLLLLSSSSPSSRANLELHRILLAYHCILYVGSRHLVRVLFISSLSIRSITLYR